MRFFALIFASIAAVVLALGSVHFWGKGQQYLPFEHKFTQAPTPWLVVPWEQNFWIEKKADLVLWANIYLSEQGLILVAPTTEVVLKTRDREQSPTPRRPLLNDLLQQYPTQRFVLNVLDNRVEILGALDKAFETEKRSERILIQSEFNNVLTSLKDLMPRMLFGSTPADLMRLKSFDSMWILSSVPFKGDAFVGNLRSRGSKLSLNSEISAELKRRYKKIILGPLQNQEEVDLALGLGADGIFLEKPEWYLVKSK